MSYDEDIRGWDSTHGKKYCVVHDCYYEEKCKECEDEEEEET